MVLVRALESELVIPQFRTAAELAMRLSSFYAASRSPSELETPIRTVGQLVLVTISSSGAVNRSESASVSAKVFSFSVKR